ncbi:MAG TPA: hypothetical protein VG983_11055, partial [Caulobacterales bacterium]|nr:hypothetical protein [Caulobacterales bacterium]
SYEMIARYVAPHFQQLNVNRERSMEWVRANRGAFTAQSRMAVGARIAQHMEEKGAENINPMMAAAIKGAAAARAKAEAGEKKDKK